MLVDQRGVPKEPDVELCLSGHRHTAAGANTAGVWYVRGGAWWNGSEYDFPPCCGRRDLLADRTSRYDFVDYG